MVTFLTMNIVSCRAFADLFKKRLEYEVLTAVVIESSVFWDIALCSPLEVTRLFGGRFRLYLESPDYPKQGTNMKEATTANWLHCAMPHVIVLSFKKSLLLSN
jgi:hypothetical protein